MSRSSQIWQSVVAFVQSRRGATWALTITAVCVALAVVALAAGVWIPPDGAEVATTEIVHEMDVDPRATLQTPEAVPFEELPDASEADTAEAIASPAAGPSPDMSQARAVITPAPAPAPAIVTVASSESKARSIPMVLPQKAPTPKTTVAASPAAVRKQASGSATVAKKPGDVTASGTAVAAASPRPAVNPHPAKSPAAPASPAPPAKTGTAAAIAARASRAGAPLSKSTVRRVAPSAATGVGAFTAGSVPASVAVAAPALPSSHAAVANSASARWETTAHSAAPQPPAFGAGQSTTVVGHIVGPAASDAMSNSTQTVYLVDLNTWQTIPGVVDRSGNFSFRNLVPGGTYCIVAWHHTRTVSEVRYEDTRLPTSKVSQSRLSWHQTLEAQRPGTYALYLTQVNADPSYRADLMPATQPIVGAPYREWRRAELIQVNGQGPG